MLRRCFLLWHALWRMSWAFLRANWYLKMRMSPDLNLPPSMVLSQNERSRIRHYVFGATYLSIIFCTLRGRRMDRAEQSRVANLAALASLFDDLVDGTKLQTTDLNVFSAAADKRGIAMYLLEQLRTRLPVSNLQAFEQCLPRIFLVETTTSPSSDVTALQVVAAEKGGSSVLLFRYLFTPPPSMQEQDTMMSFGHLIQLSDDILDVWFDVRDGNKTMATQLIEDRQLDTLSMHFEQLLHQTKRSFKQLSIPRYRVCLSLVMLDALAAVVHTALFRYAQMEMRLGRLPLTDRQAMVLDMATWRNRLRVGWLILFHRCLTQGVP